MALNLAVYLGWRYADSAQLVLMHRNFSVSWQLAFVEGRWWTLLTTVFSHESLIHFLINMFVLNSFGTLSSEVLGVRRFLGFYLAAGLLGSVAHCLVSNFLLGAPDLGAVGASGALSGLVMLFALMFPHEKLLVFGIIPLPALFGSLAFVGLDLWGLYAQYGGGGLPLGHGAHLGGALAGVIYYVFFIRSRWIKRGAR
jgi:membrane associated rhomboid family serine protease